MNEDLRHTIESKPIPFAVELSNRNPQTAAQLMKISIQNEIQPNLVFNLARLTNLRHQESKPAMSDTLRRFEESLMAKQSVPRITKARQVSNLLSDMRMSRRSHKVSQDLTIQTGNSPAAKPIKNAHLHQSLSIKTAPINDRRQSTDGDERRHSAEPETRPVINLQQAVDVGLSHANTLRKESKQQSPNMSAAGSEFAKELKEFELATKITRNGGLPSLSKHKPTRRTTQPPFQNKHKVADTADNT